MNTFWVCAYAGLVDDSYSTWGAVLEFLFTIFIMICGIRINYKFLMNLRQERKNTPLGRKGNVIEPIMSWFCWLQIFYWSYYLLYFWINMNGIIPVEWMNEFWCSIFTHLILAGRLVCCFNSLFVVMIRYIYIVHNKRANQWSFEKVGNLFRNLSILVPWLFSILGLFFGSGEMYTYNPKFEKCYFSQHVTEDVKRYKPLYVWTLSILPEAMVKTIRWIRLVLLGIGASNMVEIYMYLSIYGAIKR